MFSSRKTQHFSYSTSRIFDCLWWMICYHSLCLGVVCFTFYGFIVPWYSSVQPIISKNSYVGWCCSLWYLIHLFVLHIKGVSVEWVMILPIITELRGSTSEYSFICKYIVLMKNEDCSNEKWRYMSNYYQLCFLNISYFWPISSSILFGS